MRTFDGLEITLTGRKDGPRSLISLAVQSSAAAGAGDAQQLSARVAGWEFQIPDYKYAAIFAPLDELLKPLPEPAGKPPKSAAKAKP